MPWKKCSTTEGNLQRIVFLKKNVAKYIKQVWGVGGAAAAPPLRAF
jgi:hypothetical protein